MHDQSTLLPSYMSGLFFWGTNELVVAVLVLE
uniref:Uncharacterized protein n=1 Tax=Setaria italica TaxID=4555 RepID=K3XTM2_SETIT